MIAVDSFPAAPQQGVRLSQYVTLLQNRMSQDDPINGIPDECPAFNL